jgi:aspartate aminotransferase-like enzyme
LTLALEKLLAEGLESVFDRHAHIGQFTRDGIQSLGLELLVRDEARASNAVTAVKIPAGVDGAKLVGLMRTEENVVLAEGRGKLDGRIFRIGHMGMVSEEDITEVIQALKRVLPKVGFSAPT